MENRDIEKHRNNGQTYHQQNNHSNYYAQQQPPPSYYVTSTRRWRSWLVPMIVVANVAVFIVVMVVNNCPKNYFGLDDCFPKFLGRLSFQPLRENPLLGPSSQTLLKMGALQWDKVVHEHQRWRLLTCFWLHGGVFHLLANMLSLVFVGIRLEQEFGFVRIGLLYLVSGIGGAILSTLFLQRSVSVGASGALFGLLGAMLSDLITNWTTYQSKAAALFTLLFMIAIDLAIGILPIIDNFAHIGGFVTGFLLGFILLLRPQYGWLERHQLAEHARVKSKYLLYQQILFVLALAALIAGFVVGLVMLFQGKNGNDHCKWCHYIDCVPSSRWECGR
ncbi:hypothetical protein RND81_08G118600 [Saponaria officinalis]|uniref:RHOMBOID-like protein n=1 Tax=Saponaria officinalis TaxID=3572 RepID=A0AAW1J696_SAPOF